MMFLLLNTLFMFLIAFLPGSKCLLISWLQSPSTVVLEAKMKKSVTASTLSPSNAMKDGAESHDLRFLIFNFKLAKYVQMLTGNIQFVTVIDC